jgi:CubicO group peptidase (beta-lactamase class C family)
VDAGSAERLFADIDAAARESRFSGVVSMRASPGAPFERAYGFADRANGITNTMAMRFGTASATKGFTALAACALVESGRLALDTPVIDVVDAELPHVAPEVTVERLLTHTSGIGDYYDEDVVTDFTDYQVSVPWSRLERVRDYLPLLAEPPPKFAPGERFSYSNSGFVMLGLVVEAVAGVAYQEFVETRIFERAGMSESGFFRFDRLPGSTALGYIDEEDGTWRTNVYSLPVVGGPDGGAFCTMADMGRFWSALHGDRILGPEWRERFLTPQVSLPEAGSSYGLGVWIAEGADGRRYHYLEGADAGVTFTSLHGRDAGVEYALACNAPPSGREIAALLDREILGIDPR